MKLLLSQWLFNQLFAFTKLIYYTININNIFSQSTSGLKVLHINKTKNTSLKRHTS